MYQTAHYLLTALYLISANAAARGVLIVRLLHRLLATGLWRRVRPERAECKLIRT